MNPAFILDASLVVTGLVDAERSIGAAKVLQQLETKTATSPIVFRLETANAIYNLERAGKLTVSEAAKLTEAIHKLPIIFDRAATRMSPKEFWSLAKRFQLKVYDALYLDLAIRLQLPIATLDTRLAGAALRHRVQILP